MAEEELWSMKQVADYLGITLQSVQSLASRGNWEGAWVEHGFLHGQVMGQS